MAQDLTEKRRRIATNAADQANALWNAVIALHELNLEFLQTGNFEDTDFDAAHAPQLNAFLTGLFLGTVAPAIQTFLETALPGGPVPRDILLQMKP
jgi:nitroreductase